MLGPNEVVCGLAAHLVNVWKLKPVQNISPNLENIKILNRVRLIAINSQIAMILFATFYLDILLPLQSLFALVTFEIAWQLFSRHRVKNVSVISSREVLLHILFDSLILAGLIYFSGGPNNPFIYLLLLSIALGTVMLKPRELIIVAALELSLYSLLNIFQRPLELGESSPLASFHLHLMGMWVNFGLTVILIALFGYLARQSLLKKEKQIRQLREKQLKDEQVLSLGIMSAGAAHELGTPLSTMAIVVDDLKHEAIPESIQDDLELLSQQINSSREIIQALGDKSRRIRQQLAMQGQAMQDVTLKEQLEKIVENWLVYRPQIQLKQKWHPGAAELSMNLPISVEQAVTNLLDNAADAGLANRQEVVEVVFAIESDQLIIEIRDQGQGITTEQKEAAVNHIQETQKKDGLGWGLFLSNASIERVGGKVRLLPYEAGGTITRISLPQKALL